MKQTTIITITICIVLLIAVTAPLITGIPMSDSKANIIGDIILALIVIIMQKKESNQ